MKGGGVIWQPPHRRDEPPHVSIREYIFPGGASTNDRSKSGEGSFRPLVVDLTPDLPTVPRDKQSVSREQSIHAPPVPTVLNSVESTEHGLSYRANFC